MPKERDPFRKYVEQEVGNKKWKCKFCGIESSGSATRIRAHLAGIPRYGIKGCEKVDHLVRAEASKEIKGELDKSTGGTSGEEMEGTDTQDSNQLGCVPQQESLPPDDRTPDNLDTSQPSSLLYLSETPAQPDLSTHLEFEVDVLPTPLLNKITPTCISPDSDGEDPGSAEQFANEVLLDSLPGTAPARPQDQESLSRADRPRDNLDNTQQSDPSNCRTDAANGIENASSPQRRPMDLSASPYHYFTELEPLFQLPVAFEHMDIDPFVSQASNNALPSPQHLPCGTGLTGPSSLPDMNEGAPITSHQNTGNNFGESSASKRKLELLYSKEAIIRDELEFAASLSLKKPRMEVVNWLANVEMLRNDCTEATSEDCLPSNQPVDKLLHGIEDLMRQGKGLFEARETKVSKLLEEKMVGEAFKRNTMKILEHLEGNQISRLGIYGMGGVGKTTIMVHTHNRLLEKTNNGKVLWITVSQDFNTQMLQDTIAKELDLGKLQEKDVRRRATMLCNCLMERGKSIVILDDVWECFDLKEVGIPDKADNIKLVFTTRSFKVCHQMQCQEMIRIEPLSHTEAESLFLEELGSEVTLSLETRPAVESIVRECAGLPLAIITMARSMRGVTDVFEWKDYLEKLRESDMGKTDMETQVLKKLEFSYKCLGGHEIQQCFLSCALYPEDELIDKFELIEFFIDQGLIDRLNTREKQYNRGLTILSELANVCLLEVHGSRMKMHDLIRDMALHIMSVTSIVKVRNRLRRIPPEEYWTNGLRRIPPEEYWTDDLEKVSLMGNHIEEFPLNMSPNCPKLSTLLLNGILFCEAIPDSFFRQLWGLKVLNLSEVKLKELPGSISDLVNLRALLLRRCQDLRRIPYLGKLKSLRKLDICGCVRVEALEGLEMLVNLRYLDLSHTRIGRLPKGTLGALRNLQYLRGLLVNGEDITKLWALETLVCYFEDVDDFNKFVKVAFEKRNNPRYYKLKVCQEELKYYELKDYLVVNDDVPSENCERSVDIVTWSHAIVCVGGEINGSGVCILIPQDVQVLRVIKCDGTTNLFDVSLLENLEKLIIVKLKNLRVLSGGQDEEIINIHDSPAPAPTSLLFPSLRVLIIRKCPKVKYLFGHGPKFDLPHLRKIVIENCEEMVGITSPPPQPAPNLPSLEKITVMECDKMKRVVESEWLPHFPNLRSINLLYCENMEEIIRGLPPYMPVEEISLEQLLVEECHNMRKLFSHKWLLHLRNLQHISVIGCKGMVEMISGAGQDQEGSITTPINNTPPSSRSSISLPELKYLWLNNLPRLKSICEVPITCDSMEQLRVMGCPELNRIPLQLRFLDIKDLPYIEVEGEEKWKTLIWDHPNAQALLQSHLSIAAGVHGIYQASADLWQRSELRKMKLKASVGCG